MAKKLQTEITKKAQKLLDYFENATINYSAFPSVPMLDRKTKARLALRKFILDLQIQVKKAHATRYR